MLISKGHRNVLIVKPLKNWLSMFYLSVYHMIPSMKISWITLRKFILLKLLFVVVFSQRHVLSRENERYVTK